MLILKSCVIEVCDGFTFMDTTGPYADPSNLGGYGTENSIDGPSDFDTYLLKVWFPESDPAGEPDYTLNLLTAVPAPDADGYYSWSVTATMMGLQAMTSGVYTFSAQATLGQGVFISDNVKIFVKDLKATVIDPMMKKYDPTCACADGCEDPALIFAQFLTVSCDGICDASKAQTIINALYDKQNCC